MQIGNNNQISLLHLKRNYIKRVKGLRQSMSRLSDDNAVESNVVNDPSGSAMSERLRLLSFDTAFASTALKGKLDYFKSADDLMRLTQDALGELGELIGRASGAGAASEERDVVLRELSTVLAEIKRLATGSDQDVADESTDRLSESALSDLADKGAEMLFDEADGYPVSAALSRGMSSDALKSYYAAYSTDEGSIHFDVDTADEAITDYKERVIDSILSIRLDSSSNIERAEEAVSLGMEFIKTTRSEVGSDVKRMELALNEMSSCGENIAATEKRISDIDVAKDSARVSKGKIIKEADLAVMAQANQWPWDVLKLID